MKSTQATFQIVVTLIASLLMSANALAGNVHTVKGECQAIYESEVCTWAKMTGDELLKFGASVPLAFAENAPLDEEMVFPPLTLARIPVPEEVTERTGVDHLGINWEVHGHPPGPFLTPHFDFHFYTSSGAEIEAIDCSDLRKPDSVPTAYVLPDIAIPDMGTLIGLCVPHMGMHAITEGEMNATELFGASMVVGYYAREIIFFEPMIARNKLLERAGFSIEMPTLPDRGGDLSWPVSFKAVYDKEADAYQFIFTMD